MHCDPTALMAATETAVTAKGDAKPDGPNTEMPATDLFSALLAALTPTATVTSAVSGEVETEAQTGTTGEGQDESAGGAGKAGDAVTFAMPRLAPRADLPAAPMEVTREAGGLPLVPQATLVTEAVAPSEAKSTTAGSVAVSVADQDTEAPNTMPEPPRPAQPAAAATTTATRPESGVPDGRPVPVQPTTVAHAPTTRPQVQIDDQAPDAVVEAEPKTTVVADGSSDTPPGDAEALAPQPTAGTAQPAAAGANAEPASTATATMAAADVEAPQPLAGPAPTAGVEATARPLTPTAVEQGGDPAPPADAQNIRAQVARQVGDRLDGGAGGPQRITLQLDPEHLGKVEVRVTVRGDQLQVEFQAESAEASAALREGRHELVRNLSTQAGRWQQIEIKVSEPEGSSFEAEEQDEERSEQGSRRERDPEQRRRRRGER